MNDKSRVSEDESKKWDDESRVSKDESTKWDDESRVSKDESWFKRKVQGFQDK